MAFIYRVRVYAPVAVGLIVFLSGTAPTRASDGNTSGSHIADVQTRAERGYAKQQFELAQAYFEGRGVPQDFEKAAYWYEKAAKSGSPEAENQIGYLYQKGIGVRMDPGRAVHWYQLSAASGLVWAKVNLAICYLRGQGVPKNVSTARQLLLEAVEKGEGLGAAYLGSIELFGLDGQKDVSAAERWFLSGTRLHDPIATYGLAFLYTTSDKHPHDLQKGADLLRSSSRKGYVAAMHALGVLLVNHPEIPQANGEARTMLEQASSAGNWRSTAILGVLARDGRGSPADAAAASYFFHLAALQGGPQAEQVVVADLQALSHRLPGETMSASAVRAQAWFQQHRVAIPFLPDADKHDRLSSSASMDDAAM